MKKILLMFLVSSVLYLAFTVIISIVMNPMVYIDETLKWQGQLLMVCNLILTVIVTWLIFKRAFSNVLPSIFITIIIANFWKVISQIIDGDISIAHVLLVVLSVFMFITIYKVVNNEVSK